MFTLQTTLSYRKALLLQEITSLEVEVETRAVEGDGCSEHECWVHLSPGKSSWSRGSASDARRLAGHARIVHAAGCVSCLAGRFFTAEPPGKPWMTTELLPSAVQRSPLQLLTCLAV